MKTLLQCIALVAGLLSTAACTAVNLNPGKLMLDTVSGANPMFPSTGGLLFTHTIKPLDLNARATPSDMDMKRGDIKHFKYNVVDVRWDSNGIGDIAREHGMETIYFADLETFSILGIWNQYRVHVYGR